MYYLRNFGSNEVAVVPLMPVLLDQFRGWCLSLSSDEIARQYLAGRFSCLDSPAVSGFHFQIIATGLCNLRDKNRFLEIAMFDLARFYDPKIEREVCIFEPGEAKSRGGYGESGLTQKAASGPQYSEVSEGEGSHVTYA